MWGFKKFLRDAIRSILLILFALGLVLLNVLVNK